MRKDKFKRYEIKVISLWKSSEDGKTLSSNMYSWDYFNCNRAARYFGRLDYKKLIPGDRVLSVREHLYRDKAKRRGNNGLKSGNCKTSNHLKKRVKTKKEKV